MQGLNVASFKVLDSSIENKALQILFEWNREVKE